MLRSPELDMGTDKGRPLDCGDGEGCTTVPVEEVDEFEDTEEVEETEEEEFVR